MPQHLMVLQLAHLCIKAGMQTGGRGCKKVRTPQEGRTTHIPWWKHGQVHNMRLIRELGSLQLGPQDMYSRGRSLCPPLFLGTAESLSAVSVLHLPLLSRGMGDGRKVVQNLCTKRCLSSHSSTPSSESPGWYCRKTHDQPRANCDRDHT